MGNLTGLETGLEKAQQPQDSYISSHETTSHAYRKPALPADNVHEKKYAEPEDDNYGQKNRNFQDENNRRRVVRVKKFEDHPSEYKAENTSTLREFRSRYGKMSIIIILVLIVLFLFFYLLNNNRANQMYNLQSSSEQIHRSTPETIYSMPDRLYTVENLYMFNKSNKNNLSLNLIPGKNKSVIEKKYQPIIIMGNLM